MDEGRDLVADSETSFGECCPLTLTTGVLEIGVVTSEIGGSTSSILVGKINAGGLVDVGHVSEREDLLVGFDAIVSSAYV